MKNRSSLRHERKISLSGLSSAEILHQIKINPALFKSHHPPRYVNNIYFDTDAYTSYHENIDGVSRRDKYRMRWYGPLTGQIVSPVLEVKIKEGYAGTKKHVLLADFVLNEDITGAQLSSMCHNQAIPARTIRLLGLMRPVMMNCYHRRYFVSADGQFRLTLDTDLACYEITPARVSFVNRLMDKTKAIIELKYAEHLDDVAGEVIKHFPYRLTKSSKFVQGLESIRMWE